MAWSYCMYLTNVRINQYASNIYIKYVSSIKTLHIGIIKSVTIVCLDYNV